MTTTQLAVDVTADGWQEVGGGAYSVTVATNGVTPFYFYIAQTAPDAGFDLKNALIGGPERSISYAGLLPADGVYVRGKDYATTVVIIKQ